MSYVVRHKNSGSYLQARDQWTNHLEDALHFNSGLKLVQYIERSAVREPPDALEIVVLHGAEEIREHVGH